MAVRGLLSASVLGGQGYTDVTIQSGSSHTFGDGEDYNAIIFRHFIGQGGSFIVFNTYTQATSVGALPGELTLGKDGNSRTFKITSASSGSVTLQYKKL